MAEDIVKLIPLVPVEIKSLLRKVGGNPEDYRITSSEDGGEPRFVLTLWDGAGPNLRLTGDANGMARIRPFEPITPVGGIGPMPGTLTTFYTVPANLKSRVWVELMYDQNGGIPFVQKVMSSVACNIFKQRTLKPGFGLRLGHYDLDAGDTIQGFSSPANSCHIHVLVDEYRGDAA